MTKYKVIKHFLGGPEVGTVLETDDRFWLELAYSGNSASPIEAQFLLDSGYIEEVDGKWKPKLGQFYYYLKGNGVGHGTWDNFPTDHDRTDLLGFYQTEAEALKARGAIKELLKNTL